MGIGDKIKEGLDKVKETVAGQDDKVDQAVEKGADFINEKTGGKYEDKVDTAKDKIQDMTGSGDTQPLVSGLSLPATSCGGEFP